MVLGMRLSLRLHFLPFSKLVALLDTLFPPRLIHIYGHSASNQLLGFSPALVEYAYVVNVYSFKV